MNKQRNLNSRDIATALVKLLPVDLVAAIIDGTLSADCDDRLTDAEVDAADMLFHRLCQECPEAMNIAMGDAQ